jgi:IS5 family transposase
MILEGSNFKKTEPIGKRKMVEPTYKEAFSQGWVKEHIKDSLNELVIFRKVIPWQRIIGKLASFYCEGKGRTAVSLRVMVALLVVGRLRCLSDEMVVSQVKENRYIQYFCNVADEGLHTFVDPSSLCTFRKRLGSKGMDIMEEEVFRRLRRAGVIRNDAQLIDSSVMEDNIIHPTDVLLLYKAFLKMRLFAERNKIPFWWDEDHLKKRWRAFNLAKKNEKVVFLWEFYLLLIPGLKIFGLHVEHGKLTDKQREKGSLLLALLTLLDEQTQLKLAGERHIDNRIVSLDEIDARPIKKGKSYPECEFGTTLQMSFNRDGFMVTAENFIGKADDPSLYPTTLELYKERMKDYPEVAVTDLGVRSQSNFNESKGKVQHVFLGRSEDVAEEKRDFCHRARSATEGFIAVAKNWRGFGRSLYQGFEGDRIWTRLCQIAHNLKKFLQLYQQEEKIEEKSLVKLGLLPA